MSTDKTVPPPPNEAPAWIGDLNAKAEEDNWDKEGELSGQKGKNHLLWLKAYGWVVMVFLVFFTVLFVGSLGSWAAHYLLPVKFHWLAGGPLSKIQSILFSGSIGGVVSLIAQKELSK